MGVPSGPGFIEHTVWMQFGGGQKLKDRIYGNMGLYSFDCFMSPPESGGWFKKKVESINQLKGEKIRFLGFGGKVMGKIGMEIAMLGWKDIVPALEKDKISAVELGAPHNDVGLGFHKITKYNYYPGWFQQTFPIELIVNKNTWSKLSKTAQEIIKTSCEKSYLSTLIKLTSTEPEAMEKLKKDGVIFKKWEEIHLKIFKKAWLELAEEKSAKDPLFAEVYASYKVFREKYSIWGDRAYLK